MALTLKRKGIEVTELYFFCYNEQNQLAQSNSLILWDRSILKEKIDEVF